MKKYIYIFTAACLTLTSCNDWLTALAPGTSTIEESFTVGENAIQTTNGCYSPLMYEQNDTYYPEWFLGDIASDDALKGGGGLADGPDYYQLDNFKTITENRWVWSFYKGQFLGIQRCNFALEMIPKMANDNVLTEKLRNRLLGEIYFLRGYYYFRLVRAFGGVPKVDFYISNSDQWIQPRASANDIWEFIISDFKKAEELLWKKSEYPASDLGRATKGAAQAMLLKAYLYRQNYTEAEIYGKKVIDSGEYDLIDDYFYQFLLEGENGRESIFEIQFNYEAYGDYGWGRSSGNFTCILTRSRNPEYGNGWGFNHPTQNLYDEFESGDFRRDAAIFNPPTAAADELYLGNKYLNKKTMWINADGTFIKLAHQSRCPLNRKEIRYADVLLMYAEACVKTGNISEAESVLEKVRARARKYAISKGAPATVLPPYPSYIPLTLDNGSQITDLTGAIRHERRVELAMEGHRWFDIVRWGIAKEVMDAYKASESVEVRSEMGDFEVGKHELLPIPVREMDRNKWGQDQQNPGY